MRVLHVVAGEKWTGVAAVVADWTRALRAEGVEAQFAFVPGHNLAQRLLPAGWARPLLSRPHGPAGLVRDVPALRAALRRERFDVVHAHLTHDHALSWLARGGTGARLALVRTIHHLRHVRRDPLTRRLFGATDAFAFANREIARAFGAEGPVHSPVVDTAAFAPGPRSDLPGLAIPAGAFVVGTVGKLAPGRGHAEAIAAAAPLADDALLLHVGKGELRPDLEGLAAGLGTSARNIWAGYQDETLPVFYRAMDAFLFTASGSQQGQRAVLEAMATGLPVVAFPVPGVADLFSDGVEGFVAADVPSATQALRRLSEDPALRRRMGDSARRRSAAFGAGAFAAQARTFYEGARAGRAGPTATPGSPSGGSWARPSGAPGRPSRPGR